MVKPVYPPYNFVAGGIKIGGWGAIVRGAIVLDPFDTTLYDNVCH